EAADAPIAVQEGVNVVEPVVGRRDGQNTAAGSKFGKLVAPLKIRHERLYAIGRRRQVPADGNLMVEGGAKFSRRHADGAAVALNRQHGVGRILVEGAMQPADEGGGGRFRQIVEGMQSVHLALQADMRPRLYLEIAAFLGRIELVLKRPLDLARR